MLRGIRHSALVVYSTQIVVHSAICAVKNNDGLLNVHLIEMLQLISVAPSFQNQNFGQDRIFYRILLTLSLIWNSILPPTTSMKRTCRHAYEHVFTLQTLKLQLDFAETLKSMSMCQAASFLQPPTEGEIEDGVIKICEQQVRKKNQAVIY